MSESEKKELVQEVVDRLTYNGEEFVSDLIDLLFVHPKKYAPEYDLGKIGDTEREHRLHEKELNEKTK